MRRWLPWAALAAVTLVVGWLAFVALAPDAVYSGDFGVKFVQARELWNNRFASLAIAPRNSFLDPDGRFSPLKAPFVFATGRGIQAIFPPAAAILQGLFVPLDGLLGMRLLSLLSISLASWATWRLSPRGWAGAACRSSSGWRRRSGSTRSSNRSTRRQSRWRRSRFVVALVGRWQRSPTPRVPRPVWHLGTAAAIRDESILLVPGLLLACWSRARVVAGRRPGRSADAWSRCRPGGRRRGAGGSAARWPRISATPSTFCAWRSALTSRPNEELPELQPLSLRQRWDYVGQYWMFGVGSDTLIAGLAAIVGICIAARA